MVLVIPKTPLMIGRAPGAAFLWGTGRLPAASNKIALVRIGAQPFRYHWLPNGAKHDPSGPGWAFRDEPGTYKKPRSPQARHAGACGRWMLRGQLLASRLGLELGAVIRRKEGYYHFVDNEWQGPYQWRYTGPDSPTHSFLVLPVRKWVALFGNLPDLPLRAFDPQSPTS